jgi:hypothetical protein
MQVEGQHFFSEKMATGARVRNAYATYPLLEDSPEKFGLILHGTIIWHHIIVKDLLVKDGHA